MQKEIMTRYRATDFLTFMRSLVFLSLLTITLSTVVFVGPTFAQTSTELQKLANAAYDKADYQEAITYCTKILATEPENQSVLFLRGSSYAESAQFEKAMTDLNKCLKYFEKDSMNLATVHHAMGRAYENARQYEEAITEFDLTESLDSTDVSVYINRGDCYYNLDRHNDAINDYTKSIEVNKGNKQLLAELYYCRGRSCSAIDRDNQALDDLNQALELGNKKINVTWERAWVYFKLKDFRKAIQDYSVVIDVRANSKTSLTKLYYWRGVSRYNLKDMKGALSDFSLSQDNGYAIGELFWYKGLAQQALEKYEDAVSSFDIAIKKFASDKKSLTTLYWCKGNCLQNLSKYPEAVEAFDKSIENNPAFRDSYKDRGAALAKMQEFLKASSSYTKAIEYTPVNDSVTLAVLYYYKALYNNSGQGPLEETIADYSKALSYKPGYKIVLYNLALAQIDNKSFEKALELLDKARELYSDDSEMTSKIEKNIVLCNEALQKKE